jgi:tripartite-type tricarboxylate transporter receptor subunit TctC
MNSERRAFNAALASAALLGALQARAQSFPDRPVRLICPYGPGTVSDRLSRALGQQLNAGWGQPVVVENVTGAGGVIGIQALAKSPPDGHAIAMIASNFAMNPAVYPRLSYDTFNDFKPVVHLTFNHFAFVVHPSFPARTLEEFVALARAKPGTIDFASSGTGGSPHLAVELLAYLAKIKLTHIPYKSNGQAVTDVLGGTVPMMATSVSTLLPHIRQGKLRALAVTGSKRSPLLPDVPTAAEAGVPGYEMKNWNGIIVSSGVSDAVVGRLQKDITGIFERADFKAQVDAMGAEVELLGPADFGRRLRDEVAMWQRVVKESGLKFD